MRVDVYDNPIGTKVYVKIHNDLPTIGNKYRSAQVLLRCCRPTYPTREECYMVQFCDNGSKKAVPVSLCVRGYDMTEEMRENIL